MWLVEKLENVKSKAAAVGTGAVVAVLTAVPAFAADGATAGGSSVADTMGTAFTAVQTDFTATVAKIAPIAIAIVGVFLVWKFGLRFFKSVTGK